MLFPDNLDEHEQLAVHLKRLLRHSLSSDATRVGQDALVALSAPSRSDSHRAVLAVCFILSNIMLETDTALLRRFGRYVGLCRWFGPGEGDQVREAIINTLHSSVILGSIQDEICLNLLVGLYRNQDLLRIPRRIVESRTKIRSKFPELLLEVAMLADFLDEELAAKVIPSLTAPTKNFSRKQIAEWNNDWRERNPRLCERAKFIKQPVDRKKTINPVVPKPEVAPRFLRQFEQMDNWAAPRTPPLVTAPTGRARRDVPTSVR